MKGKAPMGRRKKRQSVPSLLPTTLPSSMQETHSPSPIHPQSPSPATQPPTMQGTHSPSPTHPPFFSTSSDFVVHPLKFKLYIPGSSVSRAEHSPEPESSDTHDASEMHTETHTDDGKIVLTIDGDSFLPSHPAANGISGIIKSHYTDAWTSWKKIPSGVVDMWFNVFLSKFSISPPDHKCARKVFETRGARTLKNILHKAHNKKPNWMGDLVWERLCQYWKSDAFEKKSARAKTNKASDCGGLGRSLHTCGSITTSQHRANLTRSTGVVPSPLSLFCHTHQHKKDKKWVDEISQTAYDKFTRNMQEKTETAANRGFPPPNELDVWCDTVGVKRGRIYGIGLESTFLTDKDDSSFSTSGWMRREEHEKIVKDMEDYWKGREDYWSNKVKDVEKERDDLQSRVENTEKQIQRIQELLNFSASGFQQHPGIEPHPIQLSTLHPDRAPHTTTTSNPDTNVAEKEQETGMRTRTKRRRTLRRV